MFLQRDRDRDSKTSLQSVVLHLAHLLKGFQSAHPGLQFTGFRSGRRPSLGAMHLAELSNKKRIGLVGFGPCHPRLGKGFDAGRIDHADGVTLLMEEAGERVAVGASGFQAGMDRSVAKPFLQALEAGRGVGERLVTRLGVRAVHEGDVEVLFADVYSEEHDALSVLAFPVSLRCVFAMCLRYSCPSASLVNASSLPPAGLRILFGLLARGVRAGR